ncbi:MAG: sugar phosphate isomerase/epimerase [Bacteroidales bacterium]|nr:sugar phosphate isomerase/epimerase [Bacteroidales bacterium]MBK8881126.1 sugar phosphate isomerase/epimerase [Bacteroidales bacterium]
MKKRSLFTIIMLIAAAGLFLPVFNSCKAPGKNIGLQLYSIRDSIGRDVPAAIAKVSKMGYKFVEPAGYQDGKFYGMEPAAFKALCDANGLKILSSHSGQALPDSAGWEATMAWWDACIDAHAAVGTTYLVQPFMGGNAYTSLDTLKMYASYFNAIGEKCKAKGIRFGYHNHDKEFSTKLDGQTVYDVLVTNTDPSKVIFEMDLYWTVVGGANPVDYFNKYPGRFELWHIKDKEEVGASGMMDFKSYWENAAKSGMVYGIVEVEEYNFDQYTSCQKSIEWLNDSPFVVMPK